MVRRTPTVPPTLTCQGPVGTPTPVARRLRADATATTKTPSAAGVAPGAPTGQLTATVSQAVTASRAGRLDTRPVTSSPGATAVVSAAPASPGMTVRPGMTSQLPRSTAGATTITPTALPRAGGDRDDRYGWPGQVDDSGVTRRRERDPEDELDPDSARHNGFFRGFGAAEDEFGHRPKRRRRSRAGMVALVVLVLFVGGLVGGGAYAYHWYSKRHADWTGSKGYGTVLVQVPAGAVACGSLENHSGQQGVVASASAFCTAAKASSQSNLLQPGTFRLHKHMGAALAWALLISPKARVQTTVAIPDGMRASKVIALLAAKTGIPLSQFQSALERHRGARPAVLGERQSGGLPVAGHL